MMREKNVIKNITKNILKKNVTKTVHQVIVTNMKIKTTGRDEETR